MKKSIIILILAFFISAGGISWDVYFSQSVDTRFATTRIANGNVELKWVIVDIINSCSTSLDICVYTLSSMDIARAIVAAKARGVSVRIIIDENYWSYPSIDSLLICGIPIIDQRFGQGTSSEFMHNKFMIVDFGDTLNEALVIGSFNFSDIPNADNIIVIRNAHNIIYNYYREFNQMWGGTSGSPDSSRAVFGAGKSEITPHMFLVDGRVVEQYFLPQDSLEVVLKRAIRSAQHEIYFSIYLFTLNSVCEEMRQRKDSLGVVVKGVFDSRGWGLPSSVASYMVGWAEVYRDSAYYSLHHKYLLVDPSYPGSDPIVVTGSSNWTRSADDNNDENLLVIHDPEIANLYLQEFAARFTEAGGRIEPVEPGLDHILISEVFYDTPGYDLIEEWIELYNPTFSPIDISGYTVNNRNDFGTHYSIPRGTIVSPRSFFIIAKDSAGFLGLGYGFNADLYANFGTLANTGDCIILKDSLGRVVDYVAWEGGGPYGMPPRWGSSTLPFANTGKSIARRSLYIDTDTYEDWLSDVLPTPKSNIAVFVEERSNAKGEIILYPIPVKTELRISNLGLRGDVEIMIYNIVGQRVGFFAKNQVENEFKIDFKGFAAGVYFIVVRVNGVTMFSKTIPIVR